MVKFRQWLIFFNLLWKFHNNLFQCNCCCASIMQSDGGPSSVPVTFWTPAGQHVLSGQGSENSRISATAAVTIPCASSLRLTHHFDSLGFMLFNAGAGLGRPNGVSKICGLSKIVFTYLSITAWSPDCPQHAVRSVPLYTPGEPRLY